MSMVIYKTDFKKGFKINLEWQYVVRNPANIFFKCPMHFWHTISFEASAKHDDIIYQDNMHWIWTIELIKFSPLVMHCGAKAPLQKACLNCDDAQKINRLHASGFDDMIVVHKT